MKQNMVEKPKRQNRIKKPDPIYKVEEDTELMKFLLKSLPHKNRDNIKSLLRDNQVFVDDEPVSQFNYHLRPGQQITISKNKIAKKKTYRGISIIYEDNDVIVIDKHAGVLSVATDNKEKFTAYTILYDHVKRKNPDGKIFIVHRLDRETSGLMMFSKSARVQKKLQENWNDIIRERVYVAAVQGVVDPPSGEISSYLRENNNMVVYSSQHDDGKYAITHYETLKSNPLYSLLKMSLRTGRKNQIRVHLHDIGHPIVGDKKYGSVVNPISRLCLHAQVLAFQHPVNGRELRFETSIPRKFHELF
jgi:23S rRNA pseudouridine1911/1915/1917 synthase